MNKVLFIITGLMILGMLSSAIAAPPDANTVLYMSFDQKPKEDVVEDQSGYGNNGTTVGKVNWISAL